MEFTKDIEFNNSPTAEQELILNYHGYLSNSPELTLVYGFGENWEHTTETPMVKTSSGFSVKINMLDFETFNFCFRNSNQEWDNNGNCNYISSISPCEVVTPEENQQKFDIDALIEEILQPILAKQAEELPTPVQISSNPIDLGLEISNILSQISLENGQTENLIEYSSLDEILSCTVIDETPIELFEEDTIQEIALEETPNVVEKEETSLIALDDPFMISPRKLSKFYSFKKHLKVSLYKLFVELPKLIFGSQEQ